MGRIIIKNIVVWFLSAWLAMSLVVMTGDSMAAVALGFVSFLLCLISWRKAVSRYELWRSVHE